jgi:hypothetical protein
MILFGYFLSNTHHEVKGLLSLLFLLLILYCNTIIMEDSTDAPQCWKSESIFVEMGPGREPIDIAPYLADTDDDAETASSLRLKPRLVFCDKLYPPVWEDRKKIEDAVKNAVSNADNVNLNLFKTKPKKKFPYTILACEFARSYRLPKNPDEIQATVYDNKEELPRVDKADIRKDRMVNKRKANRANGKKEPKRTTTTKPPPQECCTYRIRIMLDPGNCWYLPSGVGCRCHKFHPKYSSSEHRRRFDTLTKREQDDAAIYTRHGSAGVGVGILKEQTGATFSASQLRCNKNKNEITTGHVPPPAPDDSPGAGSTAEQCIRYLEKERQEGKKSFIALFHSVKHSTLLTIKKKRKAAASKLEKQRKAQASKRRKGGTELAADDTQEDEVPVADDTQKCQNLEPTESTVAGMVMEVESCDGNGIRSNTSVTLLPDEELQVESMLSPIYERLVVGQKILLAVIWVREDEKRLFELFPEVLMVDVTFGTNSEGRPLAVTASFDAFLKTFTPIRAFLPSECQWVFLWMWATAIPALLGRDNINRTQLVLTDGDSKIYNPFNSVQAALYPSAIHGLCKFHLVTQPLQKLDIRERGDDAVKGMVKT